MEDKYKEGFNDAVCAIAYKIKQIKEEAIKHETERSNNFIECCELFNTLLGSLSVEEVRERKLGELITTFTWEGEDYPLTTSDRVNRFTFIDLLRQLDEEGRRGLLDVFTTNYKDELISYIR